MNQRHPRLFALLLTIGLFSLMWLYVLEFPVFSNSIGAIRLVLSSMLAGAIVSIALIWKNKARFMPWNRHRPELALIIVFSMIFSPLPVSWLNRGLGKETLQSFEFVSETAFVASGYGILKGETMKPTGYHLRVVEKGKLRKFRYKNQSYFPLTQTGEIISLPVCNGVFGIRVVTLK